MSEMRPSTMVAGDAKLTSPTILVVTKNNLHLFYTFREALLLYTNLGLAIRQYKLEYMDNDLEPDIRDP